MLPVPYQVPYALNTCPEHGLRVRHGSFQRKEDGARIQRFRCPKCKRSWSHSTGHIFYRQHRRRINGTVAFLLASGMSQRRIAVGLRANRKTIVRKFLLFGALSERYLTEFNAKFAKATSIQFDEMESFEHSKCKPLSIPLAVESKTRRILGLDVCVMSEKGRLAKIARARYGPRKDERRKARLKLLKDLKNLVQEDAQIKTDLHQAYAGEIKTHFPHATHFQTKGRRGCVVGQGELKAGVHDPIFSLNHTAAMFRENVNRLKRKTWSTTKKPERLKLHMLIYAVYHNLALKLDVAS